MRYDRIFAETPHITPTQRAYRSFSAHHLYPVRIDFGKCGRSRAAFMRELIARDITCQVHYIPAHYHPYYRTHGHRRDSFPQTEQYYEQALSLPLYYGLTDEEQDYVAAQFKGLLT